LAGPAVLKLARWVSHRSGMPKREEAENQTIPCPQCGETARLIGIERDSRNARVYVLTFECPRGHVATTTSPN